MSGGDEIFGFAKDLERASAKVARALYTVYEQEGETFAQDWAKNAQENVGNSQSRFYPKSIDSETRVSLGIVVEIGPNSAKKQGFLGRVLELGAEKNAPQLNGLRALPIAAKRLERACDTTITYLVP